MTNYILIAILLASFANAQSLYHTRDEIKDSPPYTGHTWEDWKEYCKTYKLNFVSCAHTDDFEGCKKNLLAARESSGCEDLCKARLLAGVYWGGTFDYEKKFKTKQEKIDGLNTVSYCIIDAPDTYAKNKCLKDNGVLNTLVIEIEEAGNE